MKLSQAKLILEANIAAGHNTLLVGAPGVGKTDLYNKIANDKGMVFKTMHPVVSDPTDFKGLPWVKMTETEDKQFAVFLPFGDLVAMIEAKTPMLVLMDDIGQAPPAVQAALMQLLLSRCIGEHKVSDKVVFAAATNRREDRAGVSGMLEPVKSRFATIVHVEPDYESWKEWALSDGNIDESIISFLNMKPDLLHRFEPTAEITNSPSPRTWASLDKQVKLDLPRSVELHAYAGAIGEGAATEYAGFRRCYTQLPAWEDILNAPDVAKVPGEAHAMYAVAGMVSFHVSKQNFADVIKYIYRLPEEFGVLCIRDALRKEPTIVNTPEWTRFLSSDLGRLCTGN